MQSGGTNILQAAERQAVTIRMRYTRAAGSNTVAAQYQIVAPASAATPDWVDFPASAGWNNSGGLALAPAGGPRRDSAGSRIGLLAAGNFPGNAGAYPYTGTPAEMKVDYFRVTPDVCPEPDETAPVTSAQLNGAAPAATYGGPVNVTLTATDEPAERPVLVVRPPGRSRARWPSTTSTRRAPRGIPPRSTPRWATSSGGTSPPPPPGSRTTSG